MILTRVKKKLSEKRKKKICSLYRKGMQWRDPKKNEEKKKSPFKILDPVKRKKLGRGREASKRPSLVIS